MNLLSYIRGKRKGKEARRIESKAMQDPFLAEALEGFDSVAGNHAKTIERMQRRLDESLRPRGRNIQMWLSIAASVVIIAGVGYYLLLREPLQAPMLSDAEQVRTDSLGKTETIAMTDSKEKSVSEQPLSQPSLSPPLPAIHDLHIVESDLVSSESTEEEYSAELSESVALIPTVTEQEEHPAERHIVAADEVAKQQSFSDFRSDGRKRSEAAASEKQRIQGKVTDESGEPIPGVNISVKGTTLGTFTNAEGEFALNVDTGAIIRAGFIGYETREMKPDTSQMLIAMHEDTQLLEEVTVIAYQTMKKRDLTGSVSVIKEEAKTGKDGKPVPIIGKRAYKRYLEKNIIHPKDENCVGVRGEVEIRFSVDVSGRPYNLTVVKSLCESADREAMRLITEGCDWTQGNAEAVMMVKF